MSEPLFGEPGEFYYSHEIPGAGRLAVDRLSTHSFDGRAEYEWVVYNGSGRIVGSGRDLRSGVSGHPSAREMMSTLLDFLAACAESRQYGSPESENWNLFPDAVASWAAEHSTELEYAALELSPEQ